MGAAKGKGVETSVSALNRQYRELCDEYVASGFDRAVGRRLDSVFGARKRVLYRPVERS